MLSRHLPLITARIHFNAVPIPPLPVITSRTFFAEGERAPRDLTPSISGNESTADDNDGIIDPDGESEVSDNSEEDECSSTLIPKPAGEPGRPNSGGYSLEDALAPLGKELLGKVIVGIETFP